ARKTGVSSPSFLPDRPVCLVELNGQFIVLHRVQPETDPSSLAHVRRDEDPLGCGGDELLLGACRGVAPDRVAAAAVVVVAAGKHGVATALCPKGGFTPGQFFGRPFHLEANTANAIDGSLCGR